MPLALSQVRVDSLLGASCPECEVRVGQGKLPGCGLTCYLVRYLTWAVGLFTKVCVGHINYLKLSY